MTNTPKIALESKENFKIAVRSSLAKMIANDEKITIDAIIKRSSYENGTPVGETTIYAKNRQGEYVHADLRAEIERAKNGIKRRSERETVSAKSGSDLKNQIKSLNYLNKSLADQIVEQQFKIKELQQETDSTGTWKTHAIEQLYIAAGIVNRLTCNSIKDFKTLFSSLNSDVYFSKDAIIRLDAMVTSYLAENTKVQKLNSEALPQIGKRLRK